MSPLLMAIRLQLEPVVDALCKRGADGNSSDENGNTPLWIALKSRQMDIAATLVSIILFNSCVIIDSYVLSPLGSSSKYVPK